MRAPAAPAVVRARVRHVRRRPFRYALAHRTTMWLVDADDSRPLALKVRAFLDGHSLGWSADRVLVLANARSLGYVFDPLTTYFCLDAEGRLEGVLAEVHNTYGERHCYPLALEGGAATAGRRASG